MRRPSKGLQQRLRKSVFILPSLFTTGNLLLGFYAIILGFRERFATAAAMIFIATVIDMLDGRIARMTHTESDFGREYDSLADLTTFGTAPALLAFFWGLQELPRVGWIVPLFFVVCCATRLARFNIQDGPADSRFFVGMPAPAAACSFSSIIFAFPSLGEVPAFWSKVLTVVVLASLIALGALMVSTFRYLSFKRFDLRRPWSYRVVLPMFAIVTMVALRPEAFFLSMAILYTAPPPTLWLINRLRRPTSGSEDQATAKPPVEEHE